MTGRVGLALEELAPDGVAMYIAPDEFLSRFTGSMHSRVSALIMLELRSNQALTKGCGVAVAAADPRTPPKIANSGHNENRVGGERHRAPRLTSQMFVTRITWISHPFLPFTATCILFVCPRHELLG